jgi:hypothetical protein
MPEGLILKRTGFHRDSPRRGGLAYECGTTLLRSGEDRRSMCIDSCLKEACPLREILRCILVQARLKGDQACRSGKRQILVRTLSRSITGTMICFIRV